MSTAASNLPPDPNDREFAFTDRDFRILCELVNQHTGIVLNETKRHMVYSRLARRLRHHGLTRFEDYLEMLEKDEGREFGEFINAITTNLTAFFREPHHFEHLGAKVLPELFRAKQNTRRIRIWSAACSTGEEPYSIATVVQEAMPKTGGWDIKILATDLDTNVLAKAERGVYDLERLNGVSEARQRKWFLRGAGNQSGMVSVRPELQEMITFRQLNLIKPWPVRGPFDIVFCRNVVIYFDKETQKRLFNQFAERIEPKGYLYIGHSETLFRVCERFESLGNTIYQKT